SDVPISGSPSCTQDRDISILEIVDHVVRRDRLHVERASSRALGRCRIGSARRRVRGIDVRRRAEIAGRAGGGAGRATIGRGFTAGGRTRGGAVDGVVVVLLLVLGRAFALVLLVVPLVRRVAGFVVLVVVVLAVSVAAEGRARFRGSTGNGEAQRCEQRTQLP